MVEKRAIEKLTIKGFKSLQNVELELGKLNVLIGPNGAGKSNLISYFEMLQEMVGSRLRIWTGRQGGANRVMTFGAKNTRVITTEIRFGSDSYAFTLKHSSEDRFVFTEEFLVYGIEERDMYSLGHGHDEAVLRLHTRPNVTNPRVADFAYDAFSKYRFYHFHDTGDKALLKQTQSLFDDTYLRPDAQNLAAYLHMLSEIHEETYSEIVRIVQLAVPFFDDFVLVPREIRPDEHTIQLLWNHRGSDIPFGASQLSDGSLRFICLVTALMQPDPPSTIIIDEPELGLHPYALTLLGSLLDSASEDMQVIVATQSPQLLDEFSVDDLIVVELSNGVSDFKRLKESEFDVWLKDYSVGELWDKNVLGGGLP